MTKPDDPGAAGKELAELKKLVDELGKLVPVIGDIARQLGDIRGLTDLHTQLIKAHNELLVQLGRRK